MTVTLLDLQGLTAPADSTGDHVRALEGSFGSFAFGSFDVMSADDRDVHAT